MKKLQLSILSFNAMGLFNFDTWRSIFVARNIIKRLTKSAQMLHETDVDIIMLQEIHTYSVLKLLRKNLPSHPYVIYKPFLYGPRGGLVIFSKVPLEKPAYINFLKRGTYLNKSFIARIIKNGALLSKVKGMPIYLIDAYFTPDTDHDYSEKSRFYPYIEAQINQISEVINRLAKENNEIIISGDFNTAKNSPLYKKFVKLSKAIDLFEDEDSPTQHQEFIPKDQKAQRIDFIFLRNSKTKAVIKATKHLFTEKIAISSRQKKYLSDHIALLAKIVFQI
jgi:endonuclease/exonuclease/phosphatase family metal-dependent hydrolase